jgi:putative DNA primase/helicase
MITPDELLRGLQGVKRQGQGWQACCPGHEDRHASLSVHTGTDGRLLLHCHAGCDLEHILDAMRIDVKDLFPDSPNGKGEILATYDYTDAAGAILFQVVRFYPKDFRQRRPVGDDWEWSLGDTPRVPYRLHVVRQAVEARRRVFVVEGEKDVHTLEALGCVATCNPGGALKWTRECSEGLRGAHVIILPDNDEPGRDHAALVSGALAGIAADVMTLKLPGLSPKGDVTDWVRAGGTYEKLKELVLRPPLPDGVVGLVDAIRAVAVYGTTPMPRGIDYPWPVVNKLTRGLRPGWLAFLAGYPGHGKTAAALEAIIAAARQDKQVLFVSLEMPQDDVAIRVSQRFGLDTVPAILETTTVMLFTWPRTCTTTPTLRSPTGGTWPRLTP